MRQQTIRRAVSLQGVGLHSGKPARLVVAPGRPDTGIVFRPESGDLIPAAAESVVDSHYATTIGKNGVRIQTVEHLLAAAAGLGIDNLEVGVEGSEIPAGDGSAKPFAALLLAAGRVQQAAKRRPLSLPFPIRVGTGGRWLYAMPHDGLKISYTLDNDHPAIGTQVLAWEPTERSFVEELAPARTYGFLTDLGLLRKHGLARGVSLDNAVALDSRGTLNGLRYRDEFVRHKILDLVGDLALLGRPLHAHVIARNAGHALNFELVVAIQRALGLDRRPAAALRPVPAREVVAALDVPGRSDGLAPAPGLATV
jgi:UDP-3-O-[3-hydroxymyristoyl] N-acetylglucosamine deacetylase